MIVDAHCRLYDQGAFVEEMERLPISESDRERVVKGNFVDLVGGIEA